jgi:uncharacterized protein (UPF0335 family)
MTTDIAGAQLLAFIERIERLEADKADIAEDIKEVYAEAKGTGFEAKIIRKLIALRKMDRDTLQEQTELLRIYGAAIGFEVD